MATLSDERVLAEKVSDPRARAVLQTFSVILLTTEDAVWLRDALAKMLK